ncbi:NAD(P)H-dependent oxidoreductase [Vibrio sp. SCSIO 43137]|uniref:NAD(P)H-dependent oxidoreductase n=1 Tax=Vibrio sp. SCSIO 43137 TaxID=3021011 RepID=UPI0023077C2B|nr:NAD(P)H-dependent oxidoreductase [Vibrio sp. SCSIO 43137]WCE31493.1 NAD(P)H-dependent oxidoreductase [Vibrio sp. SCSIO 43137]
MLSALRLPRSYIGDISINTGNNMRVLIVFNHPCENSLCSSVLSSVIEGLSKAGHQIDIINLDKDNFDPVVKTKDYQAFKCSREQPIDAYQLMDTKVINYKKRMEKANHIVFIFPIWRTLMPAMIKGFIDKLIFPGIAFDYNLDGSQIYNRLDKLHSITLIATTSVHSLLYQLFLSYLIKKPCWLVFSGVSVLLIRNGWY